MKCTIAKDLLPLYADGLCSEETAAELETHIKECPDCAKQLEHFRTQLQPAEQETADKAEIKPMKKMRKKLKRRKVTAIVLSVILGILLIGSGFLGYNEFFNRYPSFSSISDVIKLNKLTRDLTKGNTQALLDVMNFSYADLYALKTTEFENLDSYKDFLKQQMDDAYAYYFEGRDIKVKLEYADYTPKVSEQEDVSPHVSYYYCYGFYEGDTLLLTLDFQKIVNDQYIIYEYPSEKSEEAMQHYFVSNKLPPDEIILDIILRYSTKGKYQAFAETGEIPESTTAWGLFFREYPDMDDPDVSFSQRLKDDVRAMMEAGWAPKDAIYSVDAFDEERGWWMYKVWFEFANPQTGDSCIMERNFAFYDYDLYVTDEEESVIIGRNGDVPAEIEEMILNLF